MLLGCLGRIRHTAPSLVFVSEVHAAVQLWPTPIRMAFPQKWRVILCVSASNSQDRVWAWAQMFSPFRKPSPFQVLLRGHPKSKDTGMRSSLVKHSGWEGGRWAGSAWTSEVGPHSVLQVNAGRLSKCSEQMWALPLPAFEDNSEHVNPLGMEPAGPADRQGTWR